MKRTTHPNAEAFPPGLSGSALRALDAAGIRSILQVARWSERDLAALHGMGPKALAALRSALRSMGMDLRRDKPQTARPRARSGEASPARQSRRTVDLTGAKGPGAIRSRMGATTPEEYLARLDDDQREALEELRKTIRAAAPGAEECVTYGIPAFRWNGMLVGFGAAAKHCAFYLMSGTVVEAHRAELAPYDTSKGTIRFTPAKALPRALVRKLVKARMVENSE